MHTGRLIIREIRHRWLTFALGVLGVVIAAGCLAAEVGMLRQHDLQTQQILAEREAETKAMMDNLEDDIRKITVNMGFNVLIPPTGQRLTDLYDAELAAELSTGERQRTALARALLPRPRLLLADEPTGNLDTDNGAAVLKHLAEFAHSGGAVLLVTHDLRAPEYTDRVYPLRQFSSSTEL